MKCPNCESSLYYMGLSIQAGAHLVRCENGHDFISRDPIMAEIAQAHLERNREANAWIENKYRTKVTA